ncbi:hypothetical protein WJX72_007015 [[Myrmecia] bisecta]|uniref:Uncharacterized protein n=1 Tax=[Myrmecia] bisecta TaxID=41462 RepID=A0AAW1QR47_9CHLO
MGSNLPGALVAGAEPTAQANAHTAGTAAQPLHVESNAKTGGQAAGQRSQRASRLDRMHPHASQPSQNQLPGDDPGGSVERGSRQPQQLDSTYQAPFAIPADHGTSEQQAVGPRRSVRTASHAAPAGAAPRARGAVGQQQELREVLAELKSLAAGGVDRLGIRQRRRLNRSRQAIFVTAAEPTTRERKQALLAGSQQARVPAPTAVNVREARTAGGDADHAVVQEQQQQQEAPVTSSEPPNQLTEECVREELLREPRPAVVFPSGSGLTPGTIASTPVQSGPSAPLPRNPTPPLQNASASVPSNPSQAAARPPSSQQPRNASRAACGRFRGQPLVTGPSELCDSSVEVSTFELADGGRRSSSEQQSRLWCGPQNPIPSPA